MKYQTAERLSQLPPYLFAKLDQIKEEEKKKGKQLISLAIGDPDLPTPQFIIERLCKEANRSENHQYPSYRGMKSFRETVSQWYARRFNVNLNPENEVLSLIGSKEGIAHIPLAFVNPGDVVLCPDPGYPVYPAATLFAGGKPVFYRLKEENQYLPDFTELESLVQKNPVKMIFLNYPNNPTSATAPVEFFEELAKFAKKHSILVCHDAAYSEIYFDEKPPVSFLEAPSAKEVGVEFHSVSKTFNMTGWRVGFVSGNASIIEGLAQIKTNIDSGIFNACQYAGMEALVRGENFCKELRSIYQQRRDLLIPALKKIGLDCPMPGATFYAWCRLPRGKKSEEFVLHLIREKGIICTPGTGFGPSGEGYVRFTLCEDIEVLKKVVEKIEQSF